jgi:hypothetical protein
VAPLYETGASSEVVVQIENIENTDCWASPAGSRSGSPSNSLDGGGSTPRANNNYNAIEGSSSSGSYGNSSGNSKSKSLNVSGNNSLSGVGIGSGFNSLSSGPSSRRGSRTDQMQNSLLWRPGHHSNQGPRSANEDRFVSIPNIEQSVHVHDSTNLGGGKADAVGYFAVFDGHSGDAAACYLQDNLLDNIRAHPRFPGET